jgi:SAM-dependent methyltransferase
MSAQVEPNVDAGALRDHIRAMYRDVAQQPDGDFHFELGRPVAERLGYPAEWLDAVPPEALASFAGVGHMLDLAAIEPGETVLDLGSGSGTDAFVAAHLTGPTGRVFGVDMTDAQLAKARRLRDGLGLDHVEFVEALIEEPPVQAGSVDVVISNGVVNLAPEKDAVFAAVARALRPGGRLAIADIVSARARRAHPPQRGAVGGVHRRRRPPPGLPRRDRGGRPARRDRAGQRGLPLPLATCARSRRQVRRDERDRARHEADQPLRLRRRPT